VMSETPTALAVTALERALAGTHRGEPAGLLDHHVGLLDAFAELGVLDAETVSDWRSRFGRAARAPRRAGARDHARAVEMLERELARGAQAPAALHTRESFSARLQVLLETGRIEWEDKPGWTARLDAVAPDTPAPSARPSYEAAALRAVIVGPERRVDGLRISSAEVYDDCVIIRWHLIVDEDIGWRAHVAAPDHIDDLARDHGPAALADDVQTAYVLVPSGIFGTPSLRTDDGRTAVLADCSVFTPGSPSAATRLSVACAGGTIELGLPHAAR
jgi:hypothetical protein